jgi:hypothetical protein
MVGGRNCFALFVDETVDRNFPRSFTGSEASKRCRKPYSTTILRQQRYTASRIGQQGRTLPSLYRGETYS